MGKTVLMEYVRFKGENRHSWESKACLAERVSKEAAVRDDGSLYLVLPLAHGSKRKERVIIPADEWYMSEKSYTEEGLKDDV